MKLPKGSGRSGDDWISQNKKTKKHAVQNDRWDREDLAKMLEAIPPFSTARRRLGEFSNTGAEAMSDTFWSFLKAEPEPEAASELSPQFRINLRINEELRNLDEYAQLKRYSENDDVQAALSCIAAEPDLQTLFDRLDKQREQADQLSGAQQALEAAQVEQGGIDEMVERWTAENQPQDEESQADADERAAKAQELADEQEAARQKVEQVENALNEAEDDFEESLDRGAATMRSSLREATNKALDEARQAQDQADAWGMERGDLQRLPANERMELARRLNNPRFKRIAELFGPMRNVMFTEQMRKVSHAKEEIHDVAIGSDIERMLPQELLHLEENEDDFLRRYAEGQLLQYELHGTERLARGGIIYCEDGSGSMSGEKELWAKAVMLCLLHLARQQKRPMHVIHFGSYGQYKIISFVTPEDFAIEHILDTAELFFGSGTDFQTPMKVAMEILQTEFATTGAVKADVVFATDDECAVPTKFMEEYISEMERMQSTTFGISVSGRTLATNGALVQMSQGKVLSIKDFYSGEEIRDIFRAL